MTHPVGQKVPNDWGLYDMIGNAEEFVSSPEVSGYGDGPYIDHDAQFDIDSTGEHAVAIQLRGGGRVGFDSIYRAARTMSYAFHNLDVGRCPGVGLRLAQTLADANRTAP